MDIKKLTTIATMARRFRAPFLPIRESRIAARTCRDLKPAFFVLVLDFSLLLTGIIS